MFLECYQQEYQSRRGIGNHLGKEDLQMDHHKRGTDPETQKALGLVCPMAQEGSNVHVIQTCMHTYKHACTRIKTSTCPQPVPSLSYNDVCEATSIPYLGHLKP